MVIESDVLEPGHELRAAGGGVWSALPDEERPGLFEGRLATLYDYVVGTGPYNRLVWGTSPRAYARFAAKAMVSSTGPLLDLGCGSAVFTAPVYRRARRPLVLVDRSPAMLRRAASRVGADRAMFVQADFWDLAAVRFRPHAFTTVACHGVLHLIDDPAAAVRRMRDQLAPGGAIFLTSLVARTRRGRAVLERLHRAGEAARPRTPDELADLLRPELPGLTMETAGGMAYLRARP